MSLAKRYFPEKEIVYIPLPFKKEYCPSATYEEGNYLYVGSVEPRKGLIYLIEALGIVKQQKPTIRFTLNIVGEIVDRDYANLLLSKAEKLNIREHVVVRGRVSDDELNDCYQRAEMFTFPSLLEGYGVVLIEAFSKGVPVVCFNNSAMPYTVKDGVNGLVADNMNTQSMADKILQLSGNLVLRKRLQEGIAMTMKELKTREDFEAGVRKLVYTLHHEKQLSN
jgi:glycosyltransferase involved in cell wall biosynthesis